MPTAVVESKASESTGEKTNKLRRFLNAYWLRPENAFWMTMRSDVLDACPLSGPSLDVSCGDGIFTFLHRGGQFDPAFDVFQCVSELDRVNTHHADMFDHVDADFHPRVVSGVSEPMTVGTDLKPSLLAKADRLGAFERTVRHDNNHPQPFEDHAFQSIYCNSAYWVERIGPFLSELARITKPGGRIILQVKLDSMRGYNLEEHREQLGDRFLRLIARGRVDSWPTLTDRSTWEKRFGQAGLEIESATPFITQTHARIWDIGLRPIAPLLAKMANGLNPSNRTEIKSEWVDLMMDLLEPLCCPTFDLSTAKDEPAEVQYVLTPRS